VDRLGIADAIKGKSQKFNTGREVIDAVARGDAGIGIGFTSEFIHVTGVKVVGALPSEIAFVNEYSAYIPAASAAADVAQALIAYLARPASRDIFKAAGAGMQGQSCGTDQRCDERANQRANTGLERIDPARVEHRRAN
jgi:molybdate transport system substrate-binding protein